MKEKEINKKKINIGNSLNTKDINLKNYSKGDILNKNELNNKNLKNIGTSQHNGNNENSLRRNDNDDSLDYSTLKNKYQELQKINSELEEKIKGFQEKSKNIEDLHNITSDLEKKKTGLIEENSRLENMKKLLEFKCADLQELSNLSVDDLKTKIISMKEVNDLLYKQLQETDKQKLEFENKLIKLQTAFNDQLEEEKREIMRLYQNKKSKENREASFISGDEDTNNILSVFEEGKNEEIEKLRNKMSLLYNENKSLKEVVKDLKKEIIDLKNKNSLTNKGYNLIGVNVNMQVDKESEKIIEELMIECNKWKKQYSTMYNENNVLKKYVSKLEKNLGIEDQMNNLRTLLAEKDQLLVNLSHQIKEYQSKCDNIIIGKSEESKDNQIKLLLNEVKGIRKRILNIITLNGRITNFEEFIEAIKCIKQLESKNKDKNIEKAFDQLTYLIEVYQQNDDNAYSNFVNEIYGEGHSNDNLVDFDNNLNYENGNNNNINYNNVNNNNNNIGYNENIYNNNMNFNSNNNNNGNNIQINNFNENDDDNDEDFEGINFDYFENNNQQNNNINNNNKNYQNKKGNNNDTDEIL